MLQAAGAEARCSCFEQGGPARPLAQREHFLGGHLAAAPHRAGGGTGGCHSSQLRPLPPEGRESPVPQFVIKCGLGVATSFQRVQYGKGGIEASPHRGEADKRHSHRVIRVNISMGPVYAPERVWYK